jgi:hypothetical protein
MQSVLLRSCPSGAASVAAAGTRSSSHRRAAIEGSNHKHAPSSLSSPARSASRTQTSDRLSISSRRPLSTSLARAAANEASEVATTPTTNAAATADAAAVAAERRKGAKTVLAELKGLDMPPNEVLRYAKGAVRLPKRAPLAADGVPVERAAEALAQLMAENDGAPTNPDPSAACNDPRALAALNHLLTDLWRWKRRGGGSRWEEDDQATSPSAVALLELQGVDVGGKAAAEAARQKEDDKGFFDAGNLNEREKQELAGMMRGAAMAGVQNAFWGSLVMSGIVLLLLNFARGG